MAIAQSEIASWGTWLRAAGRSENSIELRGYHVTRVMREIGMDPWSVSTEDLVVYLGGQAAWSHETRRSFRASLRSFYGWAQATGRRSDNPAALLPAIKLPRALPRPTPEEIYLQALVDADDQVRLMIQLAATAGLRRGEIAGLRREHLEADLVGWSLRVCGKGGHVRMVPLHDDLARVVRELPAGWLFPSPSPANAGGHLTPHYVGKLVSRALPDGWTCHTLRHRCATVAYQATRDLRAVQELLGHSKPETTARYTLVPADAVRAAMLAAAGTTAA